MVGNLAVGKLTRKCFAIAFRPSAVDCTQHSAVRCGFAATTLHTTSGALSAILSRVILLGISHKHSRYSGCVACAGIVQALPMLVSEAPCSSSRRLNTLSDISFPASPALLPTL